MTAAALFVDLYPGDRAHDLVQLVAAGLPWAGAILKLGEGLRYEYTKWARAMRGPIIESDRYGHDLFDGFYFYLRLEQDGKAQANQAWLLMDRVGREKIGTLPLLLDVERGTQTVTNRALGEVCVRAFVARWTTLAGRAPILYGGELLESWGVQDRLGCAWNWLACYGAHLGGAAGSAAFARARGTDLEHVVGWQYSGADKHDPLPVGLPETAPGCGKVDLSVLVLPGGLEAMRTSLWAERPAP